MDKPQQNLGQLVNHIRRHRVRVGHRREVFPMNDDLELDDMNDAYGPLCVVALVVFLAVARVARLCRRVTR